MIDAASPAEPVWASTEAMEADSRLFYEQTGSVPSVNQLVAFARLIRGGADQVP